MSVMLLIPVLAVIAVGGGIFAIFGMNGDKTSKRIAAMNAGGGGVIIQGKVRRDDSKKRRDVLEEKLKKLDEQRKEKRAQTLEDMLRRAGMTVSPMIFRLYFIGGGAVAGLAIFIKTGQPIAGLAIILAAGLFLPKIIAGKRIASRQKKFLAVFPSAIDVLVRGVRSGLPINDCLRVIGEEIPEPVSGEFRAITDAMAVGMSLNDALGRFFDRMPLPEVNFFRIVLIIQKQTGGNLAEALINLATVLRERKKLKLKVKALAAESNTGAAIIGSLPFVVSLLLYVITPDFIEVLFTTTLGNYLLAGGGFWMSIGIFVMRAMINFEA